MWEQIISSAEKGTLHYELALELNQYAQGNPRFKQFIMENYAILSAPVLLPYVSELRSVLQHTPHLFPLLMVYGSEFNAPLSGGVLENTSLQEMVIQLVSPEVWRALSDLDPETLVGVAAALLCLNTRKNDGVLLTFYMIVFSFPQLFKELPNIAKMSNTTIPYIFDGDVFADLSTIPHALAEDGLAFSTLKWIEKHSNQFKFENTILHPEIITLWLKMTYLGVVLYPKKLAEPLPLCSYNEIARLVEEWKNEFNDNIDVMEKLEC